MSDVRSLPGTRLAPATVLHQALETKPKAVIVLEMDENGDWTVNWSTVELRDFTFAVARLQSISLDEVGSYK